MTTTDATADDAPVDQAAPVRSSLDPRLAWLVLALPAITVAIGGWIHRWTDEDAFINFRIVDQIFAGHGPVFNAGERVEAYTSTLWLGALVAGRAALSWAMGMEWISVLFGLAAAVAAFAIAAWAGRSLVASGAVAVPVGLIAVAAVPVVWDFATSGLEMGLVWLWIAACFLALTRLAGHGSDGPAPPSARVRRWSLVVIGIGPLVRPDLGVMTVAFLGAWFLLARPRRVLRDLAIAAAIPVAYQIFRMGYFASLVPNTALAKDSSGLHLQQGWNYFTDLIGAYALWIPLVVIIGVVVARVIARIERRLTIVCIAFLAAAGLHAAYIVVSGGDYMHGRLLLPALFAVAVPATIAVPTRRPRRGDLVAAAAIVLVAGWSLVVMFGVRYPAAHPTVFGVQDISDWRTLLHGEMFHHPGPGLGVSAFQLHDDYEAGLRGYIRVFDLKPRPGRDPDALVVTMGSIGVPGWAVGPDVHVIDIGGLAEPLAARSSPIANRAAGHRKSVSERWYDVRFGAGITGPRADAARRALRCAPIRNLLRAVDGPLDAGQFLSNIWNSPSYTTLHVPRDPRVAEREFCDHAGR